MGYTDPHTFTSGEIVTAATLNATVRDNIRAAERHDGDQVDA
jgi:hypothetical protein